MYELVMGGPRPDKTVGLEGVPDVQGGARKSAPLRLDWWARAFFLKFLKFSALGKVLA